MRFRILALGVVLLALAALGMVARRPGGRPHVILICINGCRADHLSVCGYFRKTSPNLDELARRGVLFAQNYSQANESLFSEASIFTSRWPSEIAPLTYMQFAIPPDMASLPRILKARGYRTGGFTGGGHVSHVYGFGRGFDEYSDRVPFGTFMNAIPPALDWIRAHRDHPMFVFLQGYDCHRPYRKPGVFGHLYDPDYRGDADRYLSSVEMLDRIYQGRFYPDFQIKATWTWTGERPIDPRNYLELARWARPGGKRSIPLSAADIRHLRAHYDGAVTYADTWLGTFFAHLAQMGVDGSNTLFVILADHGEDLMEHGVFNHRVGLQLSNIHVPLLFYGAGVGSNRAGMRFEGVTESLDVVPTLLAMLGIPAPTGLRGRDLSPLLHGPSGPPPPDLVGRDACSEGILAESAIVNRRYELIARGCLPGTPAMAARLADEPRQSEHFELYDLRKDPDEQHNVVQDPARVRDVRELCGRLLAKERLALAARVSPPPPRVSAHLRRELREHGYW